MAQGAGVESSQASVCKEKSNVKAAGQTTDLSQYEFAVAANLLAVLHVIDIVRDGCGGWGNSPGCCHANANGCDYEGDAQSERRHDQTSDGRHAAHRRGGAAGDAGDLGLVVDIVDVVGDGVERDDVLPQDLSALREDLVEDTQATVNLVGQDGEWPGMEGRVRNTDATRTRRGRTCISGEWTYLDSSSCNVPFSSSDGSSSHSEMQPCSRWYKLLDFAAPSLPRGFKNIRLTFHRVPPLHQTVGVLWWNTQGWLRAFMHVHLWNLRVDSFRRHWPRPRPRPPDTPWRARPSGPPTTLPGCGENNHCIFHVVHVRSHSRNARYVDRPVSSHVKRSHMSRPGNKNNHGKYFGIFYKTRFISISTLFSAQEQQTYF